MHKIDIIRGVILTEKVERLSEKSNRHAFYVDPKSTKNEIKEALQMIYGEEVSSVRSSSSPKKSHSSARVRARKSGATRPTKVKKAYVDFVSPIDISGS